MESLCECTELHCFAKNANRIKNIKKTCKLIIKGFTTAKKLLEKIENVERKIYLKKKNLEKLNKKLEKYKSSKRMYDIFLWRANYYLDECSWASEMLETLDIGLDYWVERVYHENCISDLSGLSPGDIEISLKSLKRFFSSSRIFSL